MNRFIAIVALLSFAAFGDGPSPVTKTRLGSLHPREGLVVTDIDLTGHVPARAETVGTADTWTDATGVVWRVVREYGPWTHSFDGDVSVKWWFWGEDQNGETGWVGGARVGVRAGMPRVRSKDPDAVSVAWGDGNVSILSTRSVSVTTVAVDRVSYASGVDEALTNLAGAVNSKADKSALDSHEGNTKNPHKVTAAQVGAVQLLEDVNSNKTAVTIGKRNEDGTVGQYSLANGQFVNASGYSSHAEGEGTTASGQFSHSEGQGTTASGYYSHAEGYGTTASGHFSHADGYESQTIEGHQYSFVWNGDTSVINRYSSHGSGTFNINPVGGSDGFYIGEKTLSDVISGIVTNNISADNPTFSNAVLAVGLNIDTNSVAVLNEIAETFGGFPIEGTATTVGGLLAALAAAVAWLRKNKVGSFASVGGASATVENGVANLDDFFTNSNSLLTGLIESKTRGKANQSDLDALAAKVDTANAALEEVA